MINMIGFLALGEVGDVVRRDTQDHHHPAVVIPSQHHKAA